MEKDIERGEARILLDKFKIKNREIEEAVVMGLTEKGFDADITSGIELVGAYGTPVPSGSIITVYRRVKTCTSRK